MKHSDKLIKIHGEKMQKLLSTFIDKHPVRTIVILIILVLTIIYSIWIYHENHIVNITYYEVKSSRIPKSFEGFRIAQISDFHNTMLGDNNKLIIDSLRESKPDIIVITGDFLDSRNPNIEICADVAKKLTAIAPTYYSTGNHESRIPAEFNELLERFRQCNVKILQNKKRLITLGDDSIRICGIDDPDFLDPEMTPEERAEKTFKRILALENTDGKYCILLSHRPDLFQTYVESGVDLVFSGHAHGGQFRLPFIGAVFAPDEGFFPKYAEGIHTEGNTTMVVSRGLGQSIIPFRINNSPELVIAELHKI